jgi:hypothetical protein
MVGDDRTEQPGVCMGESSKRRMPVEERDFTAKLARAGQHLHTLEALIEEYRSTTAIELHRSVERRKVVWHLAIEKAPPVELALVLGDFLYNVRSTLDYLAVALLPAKHKRDAYYPILAERIWEIPEEPDEPRHLRDMRRRWALIEGNVDRRPSRSSSRTTRRAAAPRNASPCTTSPCSTECRTATGTRT